MIVPKYVVAMHDMCEAIRSVGQQFFFMFVLSIRSQCVIVSKSFDSIRKQAQLVHISFQICFRACHVLLSVILRTNY